MAKIKIQDEIPVKPKKEVILTLTPKEAILLRGLFGGLSSRDIIGYINNSYIGAILSTSEIENLQLDIYNSLESKTQELRGLLND